jgi:hypothetical protein
MFDLAQRRSKVFLKLEISFAHLVFVATDDRGLVDDTLLLLGVLLLLNLRVAFGDHFARFFHAVCVVTNQGLHDVNLVIHKFIGFRHGLLLESFFVSFLSKIIRFHDLNLLGGVCLILSFS